MTLAEALREYQAKGNKSLREMARDFDVAPGTVEGWLKDWRTPDLRHFDKIASVLGVSDLDVYRLVRGRSST